MSREQRAAIAADDVDMLCRICGLMPRVLHCLRKEALAKTPAVLAALREIGDANRETAAYLRAGIAEICARQKRCSGGRQALRAYAQPTGIRRSKYDRPG